MAVRGFVDDLAVFASSDYDIVISSKLVEYFCKWTHARVNKNKFHMGLWKWSWNSQKHKELENYSKKVLPAQWLKPVPSLKLLGVEFQASMANISELCWNLMYGKLTGVMRANQQCKMSLYGRLLFVKQHVLSLTVYLAHAIPCPSW